jgi:hypothetical protein
MNLVFKGAVVGIAALGAGHVAGKAMPNLQFGGTNLAEFGGAALGATLTLWLLQTM